MNHGDVLVIGGTSDARAICQQLDAADVRYTLSVATPTGERLAGDIRGQIRCGRMEWQQMAEWLRAQRTRWVIDASHPYAEVVSQNIVRACASVGVLLSRYQRPEQLSDLRHPLLHVVGDLNEACAVARSPRRADPADHRQQRSGGLAGGTGGENAARPGAAGAGGGSAL